MTPAHQRELLVRSRNAFRVRDYDSARRQLDQLLDVYPRSITANILMGIIAGRTGKPDEAIEFFKTAIANDKKNAEAYNNLAVTLRQMGKTEAALKAVRRAKQLNPDRPDIHYNEGNILKDLGRISDARTAYSRAIQVDPHFALAYNNLGTLHLAEGEVSRAIEQFSQGLAIDENHPTLRYNLGLAYEEQGRLNEAAEEYERSLKSKPGWVEPLNNLGIVYQRQERYGDAERAFREIVHLDTGNAVAKNNLATTYVLQGKHDKALPLYREAIELDPSYRRAATNLGQLLEHIPDEAAAGEELLRLGSLDTGNTELQLRIAAYCLRRHDHETARKTLLALLANNPEAIEAIRLLAEVYHRSGADEEADQCYAKLRAHDPTYAEHLLDRARVFIERHDHATALTELERYLEMNPGTLEAVMLKADALVDADRNDEAIQILNELRELHPGDGRILAALARAHQEGGDREQALAAADELISLQGTRASHEDIAALNESLELYEQAVEAFADEHRDSWSKNLQRLGELSRPEVEEDEVAPQSDEMEGLDEDSIPILSFGGEELLEPEEWELKVTSTDEEEEENYGMEIPEPLAPSLTTLPEENQGRVGDSAGASRGPRLDEHGFESELPPPESWAPPEQAPQPMPQPQPPPQPQRPSPPPPPQFPPEQYAPVSPPPTAEAPVEPQAVEPQATEPPATEPHAAPPQQPAAARTTPAPRVVPVPAPSLPQEAPLDEIDEEEPPDDPADDELGAEDDEAPNDEAHNEEAAEEELSEGEEAEDQHRDEAVDTEPVDEEAVDEEPVDEEAAPVAPLPDEPVEQPGPILASMPAGGGQKRQPTLPDNRARLLDYLAGLAEALPPKKRQEYLKSEARLRLEYLRARLAGRPGLMHDVERFRGHGSEHVRVAITPKRVADTISYIGTMSGFHPDASIGSALRTRVATTLAKLKQLRENSS